MIERYFSQPKVLIRLRSGSVGPYLPRFVSALEQKRFSRDTIRRYIRGADNFDITITFSKSMLSRTRREETNLLGPLAQGGLSL
jgi:hypothetical protein